MEVSARINNVLRQEREKRSWSQEKLAELINAPGAYYISRWERQVNLPSPYYREKLCQLFGKSSQELGFLPFHQEPLSLLQHSLQTEACFWSVPSLRNPFFTGREEMFQRLHFLLRLQGERAARLYALHGMHGVGKTQIAIEYAYRYVQSYAAVFWMSAESVESMQSSLRIMADLLALAGEEKEEPQRRFAAITRWLRRHHNWLLIVDGVEDVAVIKSLLPAVPAGSILFTTCLPTLGTLAESLEVEPMDLPESTSFLLKRCRNALFPSDEAEIPPDEERLARSIADHMEGLPLALDQIGAYLAQTRCSLSEFLSLFQLHTLALLKQQEPYAEYPTSVAETFQLAFAKLQCKNRLAADVLIVCCCLLSCDIPEEFFVKGAAFLGPHIASLKENRLLFNTALADLLSSALISRDTQNKTIKVLRPIKIVLFESLNVQARNQWVELVISAVNRIFAEEGGSVFALSEHFSGSLVPGCLQLIAQYHLHSVDAVQLLHRGNSLSASPTSFPQRQSEWESLHSHCAGTDFSATERIAQASGATPLTAFEAFLSSNCELRPHACANSTDLWVAYQRWIQERREEVPLSQRKFFLLLKAKGCRPDRTKARRFWWGIALKKGDDRR